MLKIAVNTTELYDLDLVCRTAAEAGFDGIDASFGRFWTAKDLRAGIIPDAAADEASFLAAATQYKNAAEKNGLAVFQTHAPYPAWRSTVSDELNAHRLQTILWSIRATAMLGAKNMILHPVSSLPTRAACWDKTMEICRAVTDEAKRCGVTVCLENLFGHRKVGDLDKMMGSVGSDFLTAAQKIDALNESAGAEVFGYCLDTGHALLAGLETKEIIPAMGGRLKALHIHDNNGMTDQHLLPYVGATNWDSFVDALAAIDYRGVLSFETHDTWKVFDPELAPAVQRLIAETGRMFARRIEERRKA